MLTFVKTAMEMQAKHKAKHSAVAIKKVVTTVEGLGLSVKGVKASPDGSFFIETEKTDGGKADAATEPNPWDEVLPDGKA